MGQKHKLFLKKKSFWLTGGFLASALFVAISFQNCGKAGFEATGETEGLSVGSVPLSIANAPFAFEAAFDQISYMSCYGDRASGNAAFYSFRAGAYDKGGLRLKKSFVDYANSQVKPIYPNVVPTIEQLKVFLSETPENVGAIPQLAIRDKGNLYVIQTAGKARPTLGQSFKNILMDPTDDRLMDPLFRIYDSSTQYFSSYFTLATAGSRMMEASLTYNTDDLLTYNVRQDMQDRFDGSSGSLLALTFATDATSGAPRFPASSSVRPYGKGYFFGFSVPGGSTVTQPESQLSSVQEYELETGNSSGAVWDCPAEYRFMIYKTADRAGCPMDPFDDISNAAYRAQLEVVRRHLKAEYWDVSLRGRCAIPKTGVGECYPADVSENKEAPVRYNATEDCSAYGTGYTGHELCPRYVSFCLRR